MSKEIAQANRVANQNTTKMVKAGEGLLKISEELLKDIVNSSKVYEELVYSIEAKSQELDACIADKELEIKNLTLKQVASNKEETERHERNLEAIRIKGENELRQAAIDFDFKMHESSEKTVRDFLAKSGKTIVLDGEINDLRKKFDELKNSTDKAIAIAENKLKASHAIEIQSNTLGFERDRANDLAALQVKDSEIKFLKEQILEYRSQISADRSARVEEASAKSQTFNFPGKN